MNWQVWSNIMVVNGQICTDWLANMATHWIADDGRKPIARMAHFLFVHFLLCSFTALIHLSCKKYWICVRLDDINEQPICCCKAVDEFNWIGGKRQCGWLSLKRRHKNNNIQKNTLLWHWQLCAILQWESRIDRIFAEMTLLSEFNIKSTAKTKTKMRFQLSENREKSLWFLSGYRLPIQPMSAPSSSKWSTDKWKPSKSIRFILHVIIVHCIWDCVSKPYALYTIFVCMYHFFSDSLTFIHSYWNLQSHILIPSKCVNIRAYSIRYSCVWCFVWFMCWFSLFYGA